MVVIIIYKSTSYSKGFISAYFKRIAKRLYVGSFNKGFTDRFIKKLKSLSSVEDQLIILVEDKKFLLGYQEIFINIEKEVLDLEGVLFFPVK